MEIRIDHVALWVADLELARDFYCGYFALDAGPLYRNEVKGFTSYFLADADGGARLEIMHRVDVVAGSTGRDLREGWTHIAFRIGSREAVDSLTERLRGDGFRVAGEPRLTGDGYYESVVEDAEGNRVELVA